MMEDLAKALVIIIISFYEQSQTQGSASALAHDVKAALSAQECI